jgi:hypothetical protein
MENVTENVDGLKILIQELKSLSTYFHTSEVRTRERQAIGNEYKLTVRRYPEHFQIRFTEFLHELADSHLASCNATTLYFDKNVQESSEARGHLKLMKDKFKLQLTAFVADVLAVFKRYQKTIQDDSLTLLDLETCTESVKTQLQSLLNTRLIGGWEEALISGISEDGLSLKGIALSIPRERRVHHLFVPALRDLTAVKKEIVYCLVEFLDQRFGVDQKILKVVKPFIALKPDADIKEFHEIICSDLPLMELSLEFNSIVTSPELLRTLQNLRFLRWCSIWQENETFTPILS